MKAQKRRQDHDGADGEGDPLGAQRPEIPGRRGLLPPPERVQGEGGGGARGEKDPRQDAPRRRGGDRRAVGRQTARGNRRERPSRRLPGQDQPGVPLRQLVIEGDRVPARRKMALGQRVLMHLELRAVDP